MPSGTPTGNYAGLTDLQNVFGINNVDTWSRLDKTDTGLNTSRVLAALNYADSEVDAYLSGVLVTPVPASQPVTYIASVIAGCWLYSSRGQLDTVSGPFGERVVNRYGPMLKSAYADLDNYVNGLKRLPGSIYTASMSPAVVTQTGSGVSCPRT